ncbi:hypothetical protein BDV95DRAFT_129771 [Massariosphaeria phaeospora]|uniref:Uncharacterized protein n=1 Tax=Massariosphaeria phaeospora TaxID=100035 RepID=A0A7C8M850_9PLEO|nr:hypothetical protein BDV95DRAFT_129771 [Massariosphaeria phaeospora]
MACYSITVVDTYLSNLSIWRTAVPQHRSRWFRSPRLRLAVTGEHRSKAASVQHQHQRLRPTVTLCIDAPLTSIQIHVPSPGTQVKQPLRWANSCTTKRRKPRLSCLGYLTWHCGYCRQSRRAISALPSAASACAFGGTYDMPNGCRGRGHTNGSRDRQAGGHRVVTASKSTQCCQGGQARNSPHPTSSPKAYRTTDPSFSSLGHLSYSLVILIAAALHLQPEAGARPHHFSLQMDQTPLLACLHCYPPPRD